MTGPSVPAAVAMLNDAAGNCTHRTASGHETVRVDNGRAYCLGCGADMTAAILGPNGVVAEPETRWFDPETASPAQRKAIAIALNTYAGDGPSADSDRLDRWSVDAVASALRAWAATIERGGRRRRTGQRR